MKIVVLDYSDGVVYFGGVENGDTEYCEKWLVDKGFSLDEVEWMVVDDLVIDGI